MARLHATRSRWNLVGRASTSIVHQRESNQVGIAGAVERRDRTGRIAALGTNACRHSSRLIPFGMANGRTAAGLAGPIVLLYLGYFASVPTLQAFVRGLFEPRLNWAEIGWGGTIVFAFMVVAGLVACVAAVRMLVDSPRFPGIVATSGSSIGRKIDLIGVTLIGCAVVVISLMGGSLTLGFFAPIVTAWLCVNTIRNYRALSKSGRAVAGR